MPGQKTFPEPLRTKVTRLDYQSLLGSNEIQTPSRQAHATLPMQGSLLQRETFQRQSGFDTSRLRGTLKALRLLIPDAPWQDVRGPARVSRDIGIYLDQHYRRIHGRCNNEEKNNNNKAPLNRTAEAETNCVSSMECGESANGTSATSGEIIDQASIASGQQSPKQSKHSACKSRKSRACFGESTEARSFTSFRRGKYRLWKPQSRS